MSIKFSKKLIDVISKSLLTISGINGTIIIVGQLDCDGVCSSGMIRIALERSGINNKYLLVKSLNTKLFNELGKLKPELVIFCDFGLSKKKIISNNYNKSIIIDHHLHYSKSYSNIIELNPNEFGFNGSRDACTSTMAYLLVFAMNNKNEDLSKFFLAGAIGDRHHYNGFSGLNKIIVDELLINNVVEKVEIPSIVGGNILEGLKNLLDPFIIAFNQPEFKISDHLQNADIDPKISINDLTLDNKIFLKNFIIDKIKAQKIYNNENIILENYIFKTELIDLNELHWLIDASARYYDIDACNGILDGDQNSIMKGKHYSNTIRKKLIKLLFRISNEILEMNNIQYFFTKNNMIKGLACGFSIDWFLNDKKPIFAFFKKDDLIYLSARGNQNMVENGLNLSKCVNEVCEKFDGGGGGHAIAAGGRFKSKYFMEFLLNIDNITSSQLSDN